MESYKNILRKLVDLLQRYIICKLSSKYYLMMGTVKTIITDKHFGFITPEDGSKDVFFHETGLQGVQFSELKSGDAVSFDVEQSEKGPRAVNVTRA